MKQQSLFSQQPAASGEGMTALSLVDSIFARAQPEQAGNVRRITRKQLDFLRDLIEAQYGADARIEAQGKLTWLPAGRHKYVIAEDRFGDRHTVMKLTNLAGAPEGRFA